MVKGAEQTRTVAETETSALPARRRFTVEEYHRMGRAGILCEDDRVELIEGDIIQMAPIGSPHAAGVAVLTRWFNIGLQDRAVVWPQNPIRLGPRTEPEPDLALLRLRADQYRDAHPTPRDILAVIEVSDTTLRYDRTTKLRLYAAAGLPEVWIVDLRRRRVLVFRDPRDGAYQQHEILGRNGSLAPLAFPDLVLPVREIFG